MSSQDILIQLVTTLFGAGAGLWVSLYFFRAQQQTDFNKLASHLMDLQKQHATDSSANSQRLEGAVRHLSSLEQALHASLRELAALRAASEAAPVSDLRTSMESLRGSYDKLQTEVATLPTKIVREFRDQQENFMRGIQAEFSRTVEASKGTLEKALMAELSPLVPSIKDQKAVTDRLVELTGYAMHALGKYQLEIVEKQSNQAIEVTGQRVTDAVQELKSEVKEVRKRLEDVISLPVLHSHSRK
ncbi:MAG TPA: hypothetical protein PJ981_15795 [Accumulibacter sp.]|nr:hypothetical protein [Accumulibacter sp.]